MIWRVLNGLRILAAVALFAISGYMAWLSTFLFDPGAFRTEGSPAGSLLFVVILLCPLVSIASGAGGIFLLALRTRADAGPVPAPAPPAPPEMLARRATRTDGSTMDLLVHGDGAALWFRHADGTGLRSHNAQSRGVDTYHPFRSVDGHALRLPRSWLVPSALAKHAFADFEQGRDWTHRLNTLATPGQPESPAVGDDRRRWEWLVEVDLTSIR